MTRADLEAALSKLDEVQPTGGRVATDGSCSHDRIAAAPIAFGLYRVVCLECGYTDTTFGTDDPAEFEYAQDGDETTYTRVRR